MGGVGGDYALALSNGGTISYVAGAASGSVSQTFVSGTWYIVGVVRSGANLTFYVNGVSVGTAVTSATPTLTVYGLATNSAGAGSAVIDVLEVDVFAGALTAAQALSEMSFLNNQFAIY
jgi:hypothetical protein